tara:strand:- start:6008 stop:8167 length:2160 start_codon:yes stop_codon:yes gene_type:complete
MSNIGILDSLGKNLNPLTNKEYSDNYKKLAKKWSTFPAYQNAEQIIKDIDENQVILMISGTGSGKTVLTPKYALHVNKYQGKIGITLPKQIIAKSAASFAAETLDVTLGVEVGYQYKGSPRNMVSNQNKLLYATDGTIVARLLRDPKLSDFDMIIIDEAHERKIQIDFLLFLLKETLKLRPEFKVIIMSATINASIFNNYFDQFKFKEINIGGKTNFPIESIFLDTPISERNYIDKGIETILDIMKKDRTGDILFFVTSANETSDVCKKITPILKSNRNEYNLVECKDGAFCIEVFAGMKADNQILAQELDEYKSTGDYCRKLVIATNVAESSLTIDGIKYVVDSGLELSSSYDPVFRARRLDKQLITHAQAKQRMGRAGRTSKGICYHLYTKEIFDNVMKRFPEPDIRVSDITNESLRFLNLEKIQTVDKLLSIYGKMIEPPKENYIRSAIMNLMQLGLVENDKITDLGRFIAETNIDPNLGVSIAIGHELKCKNELIVINGMIEAGKSNMGKYFNDPIPLIRSKKSQYKSNEDFNRALNRMKEKYESKVKKYISSTGDHVTILKLFDDYNNIHRKYFEKDRNKINEWAFKNFVNLSMLIKAKTSIKSTKRNVSKYFDTITPNFGFNIDKNVYNLPLLERIIISLILGYRNKTAIIDKSKRFYSTQFSNDLKTNISKSSTLFNKSVKDVIYHELFINSGKADLNIVSKIPTKLKNLIR